MIEGLLLLANLIAVVLLCYYANEQEQKEQDSKGKKDA